MKSCLETDIDKIVYISLKFFIFIKFVMWFIWNDRTDFFSLVPTAPINLRVLGCTITQLKIGWDPPEQLNGTLKGYYIFLGMKAIVLVSIKTEVK